MLCVEWMWTRTVAALMKLRLPEGSDVCFETGPSSIAAKRQVLAQEFLKQSQYTHLLFLDSDQVPPRHTVERLLSHNLAIVGAAIFKRIPPHMVCAWKQLADGSYESLSQLGGPGNPVQRVHATGTGCLLISRDALLRIPRPWFEHPPHESGWGEDWHFCRQAEAAGVPIYVDTSLVVGHLTVTSVDVDYVSVWQETAAAQKMIATTPGLAINPDAQPK
jgi:hypothetical protein